MLSSCTLSTKRQYESALNKWAEFCKVNNISPFNPSVANVLKFLHLMFESGLGYSSINTIRSALSFVITDLEGHSVGSNPFVVRFLKGVSKLRPPKRKYDTVWDAEKILDLIRSWPCNKDLDLKHLTLKVCGLLALLSGQRVQTLTLISVKDVVFGNNNNNVNIFIKGNVKTSKPGHVQPNILLPAFTVESILCPVLALSEYISRSRQVRSKSCNSLFVSYEKPYSSVTTQTLSRWLKLLLAEAGVDTSIYKSHSFRHASTSKAFESGVNVDVIYSSAGWTNTSSVFAKFYKCKIDERTLYAKSILNGTNK